MNIWRNNEKGTKYWYPFKLSSFRAIPSWSCSKAVNKPVWHTPLLNVQWINSWWWTDELSETCRVSWQNKFVKLVHPFGIITKKKIVTMRGHMNVKFYEMGFSPEVQRPENEFNSSPPSSVCVNTFAASYLNTQGLNNSRLKSPASTLVDLTFQSRALHSFSLNQLRNLSL